MTETLICHDFELAMDKTLTCHDFFEKFNAASQIYHAGRSTQGPVDIVDNETGELVAQLCASVWIFFKQSAFVPDEMTLMTRLAATSPELRAGGDNGRD
jgi:hypothetical protein